MADTVHFELFQALVSSERDIALHLSTTKHKVRPKDKITLVSPWFLDVDLQWWQIRDSFNYCLWNTSYIRLPWGVQSICQPAALEPAFWVFWVTPPGHFLGIGYRCQADRVFLGWIKKFGSPWGIPPATVTGVISFPSKQVRCCSCHFSELCGAQWSEWIGTEVLTEG